MKYGRQLTLTHDGAVVRSEQEFIYNFATTKRVVLYTEAVKVKDEKDMLTEWLKLLDRYKDGEIDLPGIQLLRDNNTSQLRVEKTWTPIDLH